MKDLLGVIGWIVGIVSLLIALFPISAANKTVIILLIIIICLTASIFVIIYSYKKKETGTKQKILKLESIIQENNDHQESLHNTHIDDKRKISFLRNYWGQIGAEIEILQLSEAGYNPALKKLRVDFADLNDKLLKNGGINNG